MSKIIFGFITNEILNEILIIGNLSVVFNCG